MYNVNASIFCVSVSDTKAFNASPNHDLWSFQSSLRCPPRWRVHGLVTHTLHAPLVQNTISYHIIENKSQIMGVSLTVIMNQHVDLQKISSHPRVFMT